MYNGAYCGTFGQRPLEFCILVSIIKIMPSNCSLQRKGSLRVSITCSPTKFPFISIPYIANHNCLKFCKKKKN